MMLYTDDIHAKCTEIERSGVVLSVNSQLSRIVDLCSSEVSSPVHGAHISILFLNPLRMSLSTFRLH